LSAGSPTSSAASWANGEICAAAGPAANTASKLHSITIALGPTLREGVINTPCRLPSE